MYGENQEETALIFTRLFPGSRYNELRRSMGRNVMQYSHFKPSDTYDSRLCPSELRAAKTAVASRTMTADYLRQRSTEEELAQYVREKYARKDRI